MRDFKSKIGDCLAIDDRQSSINRPITNPQSPNNSHLPNNHQSSIANFQCALRRFRFPIPARVTVSEGRPVRVQVDRQGFTSGGVAQSAGPWRTSGNWWAAFAREQPGEHRRDRLTEAASGREDGWDRDEWDVAMNDGTVYRLAVERGVGQWFLEGVID